jgi:ClpP class serine protease
MLWLLESGTFDTLSRAYNAGMRPSFEESSEYEARYSASISSGSSRVLTVAGDTAEIKVSGVLTSGPDLMAAIFGGGNVTYAELISALAEVNANPDVRDIVFNIDSPGGHFDGLFNLLSAMQSTTKPIKASISGVCASAAFAIASQADEIMASSVASRIGSVGVAISAFVLDQEVDIASTNAPKKRPDLRTEEGKAIVREELDAMHELFVDAIAEGRGVTPEKVNADFGQGATLLAGEALKRGMIDGIEGAQLSVVDNASSMTANGGGKSMEAIYMDMNELKAQHPDLYAAAVQKGQDKERDRVAAHLNAGVESGDMKTAIEAINSGSGMTQLLLSKYMTAGINRRDISARQEDSAEAADNASASDDDVKASQLEAIFAKAAESLGAEWEA